MSDRLHWGILGTGNIASQFAQAVVSGSHRTTLAAVASRQADTAAGFANRYGITRSYGDYQAVLDDPQVQAVYVALPNHLHAQWTIAALQAGKHVLCEKPLAMNSQQVQAMFDAARQADRLLIEAFMYRCHPLTRAVQQVIDSGIIGKLRLIRTSFCMKVANIDQNVRFRPEMGGGGLMDVGCYCVDFTRLFAKAEPCHVQAHGTLHPMGVDDAVAGIMRFENGLLGSFTCGMSVQADNTACLAGEEGYVEVAWPWKPPLHGAEYVIARSIPPRMDRLQQRDPMPMRQVFRVPMEQPLYAMEADAFAACVLDGQAPFMRPQDSLANMRLLEQMRQQIAASQ